MGEGNGDGGGSHGYRELVATFNVLVEEGRNVACGILRENSDDDVE